MPYVNKITVMGNLGKNPELRYLPDVTATVSIPIAYSEKRTDKQTGEVKESTEWFSALFYGGAAEAIHRYMHKANPKDITELHEKKLDKMHAAYSEAMLQIRFLKKLRSHLDQAED